MEDWNADLLLQVIQFLNYRDASQFALQSRRCYYLVQQYREKLHGPELVSSTSYEENVRTRQKTAQQVCQDAISQMQCRPQLVLGFGSLRSVLPEQIPAHVPNETVILHATAGSIQTANTGAGSEGVTCEYHSHSAMMTIGGLLSSPDTIVKPFCLDGLDEQDPADHNPAHLFDNKFHWKMFIVYVCGASGQHADCVIRNIQTAFPDATIVGGICQDAYVSKQIEWDDAMAASLPQLSSRELCNFNRAMGCPPFRSGLPKALLVELVGQRMQTKKHMLEHMDGEGICGVALAGNVPVRSVVSRGVQSLTSLRGGGGSTDGILPATLTNYSVHEAEFFTSEHEGYMFTGEVLPSYHLIRKIRDDSTGKLYTPTEMIRAFGEPDFLGLRRQHHDGFSLETPHPLSMNLNAFLLVQEPGGAGNGVNDDFVGANLDLFDLSGRQCMHDMDSCMAKLLEQTCNEEILGAVMFSCNGRGPTAGSLITENMADARRFAKVFPKVPCLGFYAGGEIGPQALGGRQSVFQKGNACVQGFTAVFALFIIPKATNHARWSLDDCPETVQAFIRSRQNAGIDATATASTMKT